MTTTNVTLTDTHAHGLARHFLASQMKPTHAAFQGALAFFERTRSPRTSKGVRRQLNHIQERLRSHAWFQSSWMTRRETVGVWVLPLIERDQLNVLRITVSSSTTRHGQFKSEILLTIPLHAIARGHQRLHDAEWPAVERELRTCALYAVAVTKVASRLGLVGFGIPAVNGLLVGDIENGHPAAKTFITPPLSVRHAQLLDAWLAFTISRSDEWERQFQALMLGADDPGEVGLINALGNAFTHSHLEYLKKPHEPLDDTVGAMWEAAREQMNKQQGLAAM